MAGGLIPPWPLWLNIDSETAGLYYSNGTKFIKLGSQQGAGDLLIVAIQSGRQINTEKLIKVNVRANNETDSARTALDNVGISL